MSTSKGEVVLCFLFVTSVFLMGFIIGRNGWEEERKKGCSR